MIVGIFTLSPTFSSLMNSVVMKSTGKISLLEITAESGSPEDIQAAVDAVAAIGGGTVYVPEGDFAFNINPNKTYNGRSTGVIILGGVSVIGAGINKTILREARSDIPEPVMFYADGLNGKRIRISGITFIGNVTNENTNNNCAVRMLRATDFRVDHCSFANFANYAVVASNYLEPYGANRGVIDHCSFDNPYKDDPNVIGAGTGGRKIWGYGVGATGTGYNWVDDIDDVLGKYDGLSNIVYIEDCNFSRCRHSVTSNSGGFYVVRHCRFYEPRPEHYGMIDVHGSSGPEGVGGRGLEAYDNEIYGCIYPPEMGNGWHSQAFCLRGGGGVVFNNTIIDCEVGVELSREGTIEQNWIKNLWIWGNVMNRLNAPSNGTLLTNPGGYTVNVDYFLYAKLDYMPYPYPHPLTLETTY
jgi:hypothetical protein